MWLSILIRVTLLFNAMHMAQSGKAKKALRSGGFDLYYKFKDHFARQTETSDGVSLPFTRETYLYSRAAKGYVQIVGRRVNANGVRRSIYARFLVESDNFGRVRFKGIHSGRYLCMTKTGQLIAKTDRRRKGKKHRKDRRDRNKRRRFSKDKKMRRCVFKELYGKSAYIAFKLIANESLHLAIDKNGQPRRGPNTKAATKSMHFIERPIGVKRGVNDISEKSRPRPNRRKNKRNKDTFSYQKSERSWPLAPEKNGISNEIVTNYIKLFKKRKNSLKRAINSLKKLRKKVVGASRDKDSKIRTRKLAKYGQELKNVISQLAKAVN